MGLLPIVVPGSAGGQTATYGPAVGEIFRYRTENTLAVSQRVLGAENHTTLRSSSVARLSLVDAGSPLMWRVGYEELGLRVEGAFPDPRSEELRGASVTLTTTSRGVVLDAVAEGVVPPGLGARYVERAAASFFPHLPSGPARAGTSWTDTLLVTEVLQGVTAEVETVVTYTIADTSALAGRPVIPIEYSGRINVQGSGTIEGTRVGLDGHGSLEGHYLYDPADRIFDLHVQQQVLESTLSLEGPGQAPVAIPSRQVLRARAERLF